LHLIASKKIDIPEIFSDVHGFTGKTGIFETEKFIVLRYIRK